MYFNIWAIYHLGQDTYKKKKEKETDSFKPL